MSQSRYVKRHNGYIYSSKDWLVTLRKTS